MLFNDYPWKLIDKFSFEISKGSSNLIALQCEDEYIKRLFISNYKKEVRDDEFEVAWIKDMTAHSLEDLFFSNSLFSQSKPILAFEADYLTKDILDLLESHTIEKKIVLIFSKQLKIFKEVEKRNLGLIFKIKKVPYWEKNQLLDFFINSMNVKLKFESMRKLLDAFELETEELYKLLNQISLLSESSEEFDEMKLCESVELKSSEFLNLFSLFIQKKFKIFFETLESLEMDYPLYTSLFSFMQRNLFKLVDQSYLNDKKKPSKFDNQILKFSKVWPNEKVVKSIEKFSDLEVLSKKRDPLLRKELQKITLGTMIQ